MAKSDVREHLVNVGVKLILSNGVNATGVKEIADAAGMPKGSFYYYFPSKDDFAAAVVDRYAGVGAERRRDVTSDASVPPLRRLRRVFEAYLAHFDSRSHTEGCLLGNISLEAADHSDLLRDRVRVAFEVWQGALEALLGEAEDRGDLPAGLRAGTAAAFLLNSWEGALVRMKAERSAEPLRCFLSVVFDHLLQTPADGSAGASRRRGKTPSSPKPRSRRPSRPKQAGV